MQVRRRSIRATLFFVSAFCGAAAFVIPPAGADFVQQGPKLVGSGAAGAAQQGQSVALAADGNTILAGGWNDNGMLGAAWVFARSGSTWTQQGPKLVGSGAVGNAFQGLSGALSADGNTALIGGPTDDGVTGAVWVFVRSGSTWTQQGSKLIGAGATGPARQGASVALSADGNTALIGGVNDGANAGATWVFVRSGTTWTQQGPRLVGSGATGNARQGSSVALSADGNTALIGGPEDNGNAGAVWIFTRSGTTWTQQGAKLVGAGAIGSATQGSSVALSGDGNTALIGGPADNGNAGATWVFTRSGATWTQQGAKLVGSGAVAGIVRQGWSVATSGDGNLALVGGVSDNGGVGATWAFTRSGTTWTQLGTKLVGSGAVGNAGQGKSVGLSGNGYTAISAATNDNAFAGAVWVFAQPALSVTPATSIAAVGNVGGPFAPPSFDYTLTASAAALDYTVSGMPDWLTVTSTSGSLAAGGGQKVISLSLNAAAAAKAAGSYGPTAITFTNATSGLGNTSVNATLTVGAPGAATVLSAVLPASRSVQVGATATAFATLINTSASTAANCGLGFGGSQPAGFKFQTTDPATNALSGTLNTPVNIPIGGAQSYVIAITPGAPFSPADIPIIAGCSNSGPAPSVVGLNTLLLSASATPVPDIVALAATAGNNGIVDIAGANGVGAFAVATVNVGITADITASADTGAASLPLTITLCRTNPATGQCVSAIGPTVTASILANETPTFAIFLQGAGNVAFNPGVNRIFVRFKDSGGVVRGATSVAARTQ